MFDPPSHLAMRRLKRRQQRRRRQITALSAALLLLAAIFAVVLAASGRTGPARAGAHVLPALHSRAHRHRGRGSFLQTEGKAEIRRLIALGRPIYCAGHRGNAVAFTFDDGPGPYTYLALRKLRQARERATFFVVGRSMHRFPGWVLRERSLAAIGDHTYTHPELTALSAGEVTSQLADTQHKIDAALGAPVDMFRPPYGLHDATVDHIATRLGLLEILWNVDSQDSLGANYAGIIRNVEARLRPGAIILMHENRGQTIRALTTLLPALHRRHMRSLTVPELLAADPPSLAQLKTGAAGCALRLGAAHTGG